MSFRDPSFAVNEMSPEAQLILLTLRRRLAPDAADEIRELIQRGVDWDCLLQTANKHGVVGLLNQSLTAHCADLVPPSIITSLQISTRENARHNLHLTQSLLKLLHHFDESSVPVLPFKGPLLAAIAYGNLSLRQFCDLDILVLEQDVLKSMKILTENGYDLVLPPGQSTPIPKLVNSKKDFRFVSTDGRVVVELHWRLAGKHFYFPYKVKHLWKRLQRISLSGVPVLTIPVEDLLVILCAHGSKHLWCRLLWICDIAELVRSNPGLDWRLTLNTARKCGSHRMLLLGLYLANTLLDAPLPNEALRAINRNRAVQDLAEDLLKSVLAAERFNGEDHDYHSPALYPAYIRMRERLRDKASLGFQYVRINFLAALTPNGNDREFFALPSSVSFLYYFLRPFRLIGRSARSHWGRR
jgi:hypothetical protein